MRLVVTAAGRPGAVEGEVVLDLEALGLPASMDEFLQAGTAGTAKLADALERAARDERFRSAASIGRLDELHLGPPLSSRARVFMAGANYPAHAAGAEGGELDDPAAVERAHQEIAEAGLRGFISFRENCIGTGDAIVHPKRTDTLDFEGEVAVVIGRSCRDVPAQRGVDYIAGYVLVNDVSARTALPSADNPRSRFARDKNFDTSKPVGPYFVIGEHADPQNITWTTRVNGVERQRGTTSDMVFGFAQMIEYLSEDFTLLPGDLIGGGTTSGTVMDSGLGIDGRGDPDRFLRPGDVIEIESPRLGTLRNAVVARPGGGSEDER